MSSIKVVQQGLEKDLLRAKEMINNGEWICSSSTHITIIRDSKQTVTIRVKMGK